MSFTRWRSLVDGTEYAPLPASFVSRDDDNGTSTESDKLGVRINTSQEWPQFYAQIGNAGTEATTAYIHNVDTGELMDTADISSLSAGDIFRFGSANLAANQDYNVVVDAGGESYNTGRLLGTEISYTSADGNLSIIDGAVGEQGVTDRDDEAYSIVAVGNFA